MSLTILVTGATDGIGLEAAKRLASLGHGVLLHGRNAKKLDAARQAVKSTAPQAIVETHKADLSNLAEVDALADAVKNQHSRLDVVINNAGVFNTPSPRTADGMDVRFVVNTVAPYRLSRRLLPLIPSSGRIVNLSSAAQASVDLRALEGEVRLDDMSAYAQSKLAITMWTRHMAAELGPNGPVVVAVNPGSMLATKMVKDAFGVSGNDLGIGADILVRAAVGDEFRNATGKYFDNDRGSFASPHSAGLDSRRAAELVTRIESISERLHQSASTVGP